MPYHAPYYTAPPCHTIPYPCHVWWMDCHYLFAHRVILVIMVTDLDMDMADAGEEMEAEEASRALNREKKSRDFSSIMTSAMSRGGGGAIEGRQ